jgi:hypothetical protein
MTALVELSSTRQLLVLTAIAALEATEGEVHERDFPALLDPDLRECVQQCLHEAGRVLIRTEGGYTSGYADDVAEALAAEGIGLLSENERAVLVLVLLHSVAIPRARGRIIGSGWANGVPVPREEIGVSQVPSTIVRNCLRRLEERRLIESVGRNREVAPGPQLSRLTPAASARLWEDLVLLAEPDGVMAAVILRRRRRESTGMDTKGAGA